MMVGQKVVCVDDKFPLGIGKFYTDLPKKGITYVIREVQLGINLKGEPGEVCLYLIGLNNPKSTTAPFPERGFNAERFRPLEDDRLKQTEKVEAVADKEEDLEEVR